MSRPILVHEKLNYSAKKPFQINLVRSTAREQAYLPHWHEELEIAYSFRGCAVFYIDGVEYENKTGEMMVVNSGSVHSIIPISPEEKIEEINVIVLQISRKFVEDCLPEYQTKVFRDNNSKVGEELRQVFYKLAEMENRSTKASGPNINLYQTGLLMQILYFLSEAGMDDRDTSVKINTQKNIERIRGVIQYVEDCYMEHITQAEVARKFYFNGEYFSRYFRQTMGVTFTEYLTDYRVRKAREDLLNTDYSIMEIAVKNGFPDGRAFSRAFQKNYQVLPSKYKKMYTEN